MIRFNVLLSVVAFCLSLPINEDTLNTSNPPEFTSNTSETKTFPASDIFISNLLPTSSISDCISSGYCNKGHCVQGIISASIKSIVQKRVNIL